ncbi:mechanosensitive ion channel family protein [Rhodophyticola sp. CCM32]|uniref:mechanosensitive ion channel family protein n=1 Tax=Rhodophyticola sp. CCM32 TaxID=2916397 RepID=UPI00107F29AD|nr:mechanosensitive ion channel family protein [Rhodophyticola sp. CCM32]QBY02149.1 mechanosensitive ion channel family protein [Rhodophyticola sp. CCM32]
MNIEQILDIDIADGITVGDIFTVDFIARLLGDVLLALVLVILAFFIAGWARRRIIALGLRHQALDDTLFTFLGNIARYVILAFAGMFILNTFGVQTTSLIAAIGAAGIAIGLALQGTLSNLAAGIMIILFRPFKNGDFVEVAGQMGTVRDISLNMTELASLSNVQVLIPNSEVWGNQIRNYSTYPTRRAEWEFGVGYGADLAEAERIIRETIMSDARSHTEPEPFVQVNTLNSSSVDFLVRVWVDAAEFFAYQADMKRKVKEALDAGGVDIPFPTRTLIYEKAGAEQMPEQE